MKAHRPPSWEIFSCLYLYSMSLMVDCRLERMSLESDSLMILLSFMMVHMCARPWDMAMSRGVSPLLFLTSNVAPL